MAKLYKPKAKAGTGDLEVLHPDRPVRVADEVWTVREYSLRDAARYHALGERLLASREAGQDDAEAMVHLLAAATGHDDIEVAGLDDADFMRLVDAWDAVNAPIFERRVDKPSAESGLRWADVYDELIAGGHRLADLGEYTARQIELFTAATMRRRNRERAENVIDINQAFAGGKPANEHVKSLRRGTP